MYLLAPFILQNFKKILKADSEFLWKNSLILQQIQSYEDVPFLGLKWPICPNEIFFTKPVKKPCSFESYLSTY